MTVPSTRGGHRRVLPASLRRCSLESLLLALMTCFTTPGPLQLVLHVDGQLAQALRLELDRVPILEGAKPAVVGAQREYVAWLQRVDRADPLDAARDLVRHVAGVVVL